MMPPTESASQSSSSIALKSSNPKNAAHAMVSNLPHVKVMRAISDAGRDMELPNAASRPTIPPIHISAVGSANQERRPKELLGTRNNPAVSLRTNKQPERTQQSISS